MLPRVALVAGCIAAAAAVACRAPAPPAGSAAPAATVADAPLAGLLTQRIVVTPVQRLRVATELGWPASPAGPVLARLDSAIAAELAARDLGRSWTLAPALVRSHARNPTYATDPTALAVEPLRGARTPAPSDRLSEPLASELRTMIALHDARLVLLPVELRIDRADSTLARASLRVVLADARTSDVRWAAELRVPAAGAIDGPLLGALARRVADLFAP